MAYLGRVPATGENNAFRILDDISSYVLTFDGSSANTVSLANDTIALSGANNRFITGQRVVYSKGAGGTIITGLAEGAHYVVRMSDTTIKLAPTANDALNQTNLRNFTGLGAGTAHKLTLAFDGINTKFKATYENGTQKPLITRAAQLVLSINGVIQQPVDSTTPSVGFGFDVSGVIIFSTAPSASDAFWGHVLASNTVTFDISDNDIDKFTGNGTTTEFNLSKIPPDNRNILVTIDGVIQYPSDNTDTKAYGLSENKLQFTSAPANGADIQVRHIGFAGASGGGGGGVSSFYGRTGAVVLKNTDNPVIGNLTAVDATFSGNVSIAKTLTYMDVTNIDAVGVSTFQDDVYFNGTGVGISSLTWDKSANSLDFKDGIKARFGDSQDLSIWHNGSNSFIEDSGTGALYIDTNHLYFRKYNTGNVLAMFQSDNKVELFHSGNSKFETTSTGVSITGIPVATQTTGNIGLELHATGSGRGSQTKYHNDHGEAYVGQAGDTTGNFLVHNSSNSDMLFATNNTERLRINSSGLFGVGTSTLEQRLNIHEADSDGCFLKVTNSTTGTGNNDGALFGITDTEAAVIWQRENNIIQLATNNTEKVRITAAGRVGIGTISPADDPLTLYDADNNVGIYFQSTATGNSNSNGLRIGRNQTHAFMWNYVNQPIAFATNGSERLTILGDGKVGINDTSPDSIFSVKDTYIFSCAGGNSTTGMQIGGYDAGANSYNPITVRASRILFNISGTEKARITTNGSLIVGNQTSTSYKLCVSEAAHTRAEIISTNNNSAGIWLKTFNSGSIVSQSTIRTSNDGNLELYAGTSSEMRRFWIDATNGTYLQGTSHTNFEVRSNSASTKAVIQTVQDTDVRMGATTNHPLALYAGTTERLRIDAAGNLSLGKGSASSTQYGRNFQIHDGGTSGATLHLTTNDTGSANSDGFHLVQQGVHIYHWLREVGDQVLATGGTERLRITSGGDIEIGTQAAHSNTLKFADSQRDDAVTMKVDNSDDSDFDIVNNRSGADITIATNSAERIRITSDGKVSIGSPSDIDHRLCVADNTSGTDLTAGNSCGIQLQNKSTTDGTFSSIEWRTSSGGRMARIAGVQEDANGDGCHLSFLTEPSSGGSVAERIRITSGGGLKFISIDSVSSTTEPAQWLNHSGGMQLYASSGTSTHRNIIFCSASNSASERLRIASTGEVGIGIATPTKTGIQNNVKVLQIDGGDGAELILGNSVSPNVSTNHVGAIAFKNIDTSTGHAPHYAGIRANCVDTSGNMNLKFYAGGATQTGFENDTPDMMIDSSGRLLIDRTSTHASSSERLSVNGMVSIQKDSTSTAGLYVFNEDTTGSGTIQPFIFLHDGGGIRGGLGLQYSTSNFIINGQSDIQFKTGSSGVSGTERVRINSTGQIKKAQGANVTSLKTYNSNADAFWLDHYQYQSSGTYQRYTDIVSIGDGSWGSNIRIFTNANGSQNGIERVRIDSNGYMGVGENNPHTGLSISKTGTRQKADGNTYYQPHGNWCTVWNNGTSNSTDYWAGFIGGYDKSGSSVNISLSSGVRNLNEQAGVYISGTSASTTTQFFSVGKIVSGSSTGASDSAGSQRATKSEWMRITPEGHMLVQATSSTGSSNDNIGFSCIYHATSPYVRIRHEGNGSGFTGHTIFHMLGHNGGLIGEIKQDGDGTVTYATSSDYRLKENVVDLTGAITRLKNLKPKRFNFKANSGLTKDGFIAHELQEVVPEAVNGTKDEVVTADSKANIPTLEDSEVGDPVYQTADASRVVPLLTAALKEAITKIEVLEAKVAALESS